MPYIEKYVYDWVIARRRALAARCTYDAKGGVFNSTDPEAWVMLGRAEQALEKYTSEWLGLEAGFGIGPKFEASKAPSLPQEPAIE